MPGMGSRKEMEHVKRNCLRCTKEIDDEKTVLKNLKIFPGENYAGL